MLPERELSDNQEKIKKRLVRADIIRTLNVPQAKLEFLTEGRKDTHISHDEFFTTIEERRELADKVDLIREHLAEKGKPASHHPEFEDWLVSKERTPDQFTGYYWKNDGPYHIAADLWKSGSDEIHDVLLFFIESTDKYEIVITLGFPGDYDFEERFNTESFSGKPIQDISSQNSISKMPQNIYKETKAALDRYIIDVIYKGV